MRARFREPMYEGGDLRKELLVDHGEVTLTFDASEGTFGDVQEYKIRKVELCVDDDGAIRLLKGAPARGEELILRLDSIYFF